MMSSLEMYRAILTALWPTWNKHKQRKYTHYDLVPRSHKQTHGQSTGLQVFASVVKVYIQLSSTVKCGDPIDHHWSHKSKQNQLQK